MNKRIMIVTASLGCGGLEKITTHIANYYAEKGWSVRILCLMSYDKNIFYKLSDDIEVVFFDVNIKKRNIFNVFPWIRFIKRNIEMFVPTHILSMTLKIGALCALSRKDKNIRLTMREISDPRSSSRSKFFDKILFFLGRKIDSIIFQTNWEMKCYPRWLRTKGRVIPNPCNVDENIVRNCKNNYIVSVGRLVNKQKKHDVLLRSFSLFLLDNPNYILKIYGDGPDLIFDQNLAHRLGIENNVIFCGNVSNIQHEIVNSSCFVLTSDFEGMSNALLEAFLLGVPCVSTDWPGVNDIITDGVDGVIVKRNSPQSISDGIKKIVENNLMASNISEQAIRKRNRYDLRNVLIEYSKQIEGDK